MSANAYPLRSTTPEARRHVVRIQGAGTSDPVNEHARSVTVTRTGAGAYRATWNENPGGFVGVSYGLTATTPADLAGHTVVTAPWDATNRRLDFVLYNATFAAHDLEATEYIALDVTFNPSGV